MSGLFRFQSTRPRGTRRKRMELAIVHSSVSIHASARDATGFGFSGIPSSPFQSTRPRGTRRLERRTAGHCGCFNPRVRAGRDDYDAVIQPLIDVSIHASARDATQTLSGDDLTVVFQSTRPRGTRPRKAYHEMELQVSIHASARDATHASGFLRSAAVFQSTRPRGTRQEIFRQVLGEDRFQSTRPRGTRLADCDAGGGCDGVSIHASARDATSERMRAGIKPRFNPRVRAGRDL